VSKAEQNHRRIPKIPASRWSDEKRVSDSRQVAPEKTGHGVDGDFGRNTGRRMPAVLPLERLKMKSDIDAMTNAIRTKSF